MLQRAVSSLTVFISSTTPGGILPGQDTCYPAQALICYNWKVSPTIKKVFPILALSTFSSMLGVGIISPLLPLYAENLGATGVWLGVIFAGFSISRTIIQPLVGRLSDRRGRKLILSIGLFVFTVTSLGYIWADSIASLALVRFLQGIAAGMVVPIAQAYMGDVAPKGEEGKWMGYFSAAFFTGFGLGPLMGGILSEHLGMNIAFYAMSGLNLIAFLGITFFLPEISRRDMATMPSVSFREVAASSVMRGLFTFRMGFAIGRGAFTTFLPILAGINLGLSPSLIGILLTVNMLGMSLLQIPGGVYADRFNRRALIVLGCAVHLTAVIFIPSSGNFWHLLVICSFLGLAGAIMMPAAAAMVVDEGKRFGMGVAMAAYNVAMSIGMAIGPILAGVIADALNTDFVFYFVAAVILLGAVVFSRLTR